ncbi:MAG: glycosyl transferase [Mizugakiibacter sp.]|uniref:glycosyl transferase n=1 Tax=Mizugakiibacter sp. TaxID=1972610 RepID=UPI0031C95DA7|nr:glycosyl transferase [Xanthomonadaceae bacterium]
MTDALRRFLSSRWPWALCLLPLVLLLPPIPIDETRYLTATWEMTLSGHWLVPTVNGVVYTDKSPFLFWLIALGWKAFGVHTWVARALALGVTWAMLELLRRLARRLALDDAAMWLLAGCFGIAIFAGAIMFDLLLAACVLLAMHALLDLDAARWRRGIGVLGLAVGLGVLAKGPVVLLHVAGAALLAPWWSATARASKARWYAALAAGIGIGAAIALAWLLPAALIGGEAYWQPLLAKVSGRLHASFAHARPLWWYLPLLPVLLLPWTLALRAPRAAWAALPRERAGRFALAWFVPPFLAFCLISGKQVHYLVPLLPALALGGAVVLGQAGARVAARLYALLALAAAAGVAVLPWWAARKYGFDAQPALALLALVPLVVAVGLWRGARAATPRGIALASTALGAAVLLGGTLALAPALDVGPTARFIAAAQAEGRPIAHIEWHNGLFGYVGRLRQPLPVIAREEVRAWCFAHPDGYVIASDGSDEPRGVAPWRTWPYFNSGHRRIGVWRAADLVAAQAAP